MKFKLICSFLATMLLFVMPVMAQTTVNTVQPIKAQTVVVPNLSKIITLTPILSSVVSATKSVLYECSFDAFSYKDDISNVNSPTLAHNFKIYKTSNEPAPLRLNISTNGETTSYFIQNYQEKNGQITANAVKFNRNGKMYIIEVSASTDEFTITDNDPLFSSVLTFKSKQRLENSKRQ